MFLEFETVSMRVVATKSSHLSSKSMRLGLGYFDIFDII